MFDKRQYMKEYLRKYNHRQRKDPTFRKKKADYMREWRQRPDIKKRQNSLECKKQSNKRVQEYRQTEKGKQTVRMFVKNRQHLKRAYKGSAITTLQWEVKIREYNYRCAYCGKRCAMTMDCVIPLSKGGTYSAENVVPACAECNDKKGAKLGWKPKVFKKVM